jgi:Flp pilus assembly pilin Flp
MRESLLRFWLDQDGATAIEYVLLGCFLGLVIYAGVSSAGSALYQKILTIW